MSDTLHTEPERDQFRTESPIRAFTDWQVHGSYALGKGFRPSLAHVINYLDAMKSKEGWELVQVLEAGTQTPSFLFRRKPTITLDPVMPEVARGYWGTDEEEDEEPFIRNREAGEEAVRKIDEARVLADTVTHERPVHDAINPAHYNGRECADIGERLSANGYQILKYCWRLGKKDDPCQELGKALWYLDSEAVFLRPFPLGHRVRPNLRGIKPGRDVSFLESRIAAQPEFTQDIARLLWAGYGRANLVQIRRVIQGQKTYLECGRSLAV